MAPFPWVGCPSPGPARLPPRRSLRGLDEPQCPGARPCAASAPLSLAHHPALGPRPLPREVHAVWPVCWSPARVPPPSGGAWAAAPRSTSISSPLLESPPSSPTGPRFRACRCNLRCACCAGSGHPPLGVRLRLAEVFQVLSRPQNLEQDPPPVLLIRVDRENMSFAHWTLCSFCSPTNRS